LSTNGRKGIGQKLEIKNMLKGNVDNSNTDTAEIAKEVINK